jgi:hypothetical protein
MRPWADYYMNSATTVLSKIENSVSKLIPDKTECLLLKTIDTWVSQVVFPLRFSD